MPVEEKKVKVSIQATPSTHRYLLHPQVDFLMIGGLSIIVAAICILFVPKNQDISTISWTMFYLAFIVNHPHFLISYQFLYIDNLKRITKDWRLFFSGVIMPAVFIAYVMWSVSISSSEHLGYVVNAMFFLVGHHYVKQIIGCVVVTSALQGVYFSKTERMILSLNMLGMWMISFFGGNLSQNLLEFHGIHYLTFQFPEMSTSICYSLILSSFLVFIGQVLQKFIKTGQWIPLNSVIAFLSIYAWYIPIFYHPIYFYMIPFFHSLQYLLFSLAYVKNRSREKLALGENEAHGRGLMLREASVYIVGSLVLGFLFFLEFQTFLIGMWLIINPCLEQNSSCFFLSFSSIFIIILLIFLFGEKTMKICANT